MSILLTRSTVYVGIQQTIGLALSILKQLTTKVLRGCVSNFMARSTPSPLMGEGEKPQAFADRHNEILFIDARNLGHLINRRTKELSHSDIKQITDTYHNWRNLPRHCEEQSDVAIQYQDIPGFCASVSIERVKELDYVLTPGRYVGLPDDEDDFNFAERFNALKAEFEAQLIEEEKLNKAIAENLSKIDARVKL